MKSKSSFIKIMFIFSILLLILFLITLFSLLKIFIIKPEEKPKKEIKEVSYNLDNKEKLMFDFKRAEVVIKTTNEDELKIIQNTKEEKMYLNINDTKNQLFVEEESYIFDGSDKKYTVKIPKKYLGSINITNGFGTLRIYNIKTSLFIDNNSGEINIFNSSNINIKDVPGRINLNDIDGVTSLSSSTGDINIKSISGSLTIDTLTGEIIVSNFNVESNSFIENISGNITLSINKDSICKVKSTNESGETRINKEKCTGKNNILEVKNVTGDINIK